MKFKSKQGFSLTELMVALAIIGILTSVAVPSYLRFANKAKQTNAKSELSGIYTAEKAFFVEYKVYHANLVYTGYMPDGIPVVSATGGGTGSASSLCPTQDYVNQWPLRYYSVGFSANSASPARVPGLAAPPNCGEQNTFFRETYSVQLQGGSGAGSVLVPTSTAVISNNFLGFNAQAIGSISDNGLTDIWHINQNRRLENTQIGI